jgi:hypothetical protein
MSRLLNAAALSFGYCLSRRVRAADVLHTVRRLRARQCDRPLIRIGAANDGGYLIPDDLDGIEYCFSPGVSMIAAFEEQLATRNIKSFLADHSVSGPPLSRPEFVFDRKFIGASDSEIFMTLHSWKEKYLMNYQRDLILQMDVEGAEYEAILGASDEVLGLFRIIVVEMHDLDHLFDPFAFRTINACIEKLLTRFFVVHLHPNNCGGCLRKDGVEIPHTMEITFYNRRRAAPGAYCTDLPHPLDADNCPRLPMMPLPNCWR